MSNNFTTPHLLVRREAITTARSIRIAGQEYAAMSNLDETKKILDAVFELTRKATDGPECVGHGEQFSWRRVLFYPGTLNHHMDSPMLERAVGFLRRLGFRVEHGDGLIAVFWPAPTPAEIRAAFAAGGEYTL